MDCLESRWAQTVHRTFSGVYQLSQVSRESFQLCSSFCGCHEDGVMCWQIPLGLTHTNKITGLFCVSTACPPPQWYIFLPLAKPVPAPAHCGYYDIALTCAAAESDSNASGKEDKSRCTLALSRNRKKNLQLQWVRDSACVTLHTFGKFDEICEVRTY